MPNFNDFIDKFATQTVYLKNTFEEAVIKCIPDGDDFVKFAGKPEFKAVKGSTLVADAVLEQTEISKKEYDNF